MVKAPIGKSFTNSSVNAGSICSRFRLLSCINLKISSVASMPSDGIILLNNFILSSTLNLFTLLSSKLKNSTKLLELSIAYCSFFTEPILSESIMSWYNSVCFSLDNFESISSLKALLEYMAVGDILNTTL